MTAALLPRGAGAVMASRREPPDSLDFFPTAPWGTRALLRHVLPAVLGRFKPRSAWDPACGEGHMAEVLREEIPVVHASDVFDYGRGYDLFDFLDPGPSPFRADLIVTNPPFGASLAFALRAIEEAVVVALLMRLNWLEGEERYRKIFNRHPPTLVAPFTERLPMHRGRWEPDGDTATAYAWFVFVQGYPPRPVFHIPPGCRKALSRSDDARRFGALAPAPLLEACS